MQAACPEAQPFVAGGEHSGGSSRFPRQNSHVSQGLSQDGSFVHGGQCWGAGLVASSIVHPLRI